MASANVPRGAHPEDGPVSANNLSAMNARNHDGDAAVDLGAETTKQIDSRADASTSAGQSGEQQQLPLPAVDIAVRRAKTSSVPVQASAPGNKPVGKARPQSTGGPAIDSVPREGNASSEEIERLAGEIHHAVKVQHYDKAGELLQQLGQQLPPESITLLRLKAWHALRSGDAQSALGLYQVIAERLPNDESAVINLSIAHWKLGRQDEARRIIASLAERRPDSEAVRHAVARLGASQ
jgi:predicted Zn-dependent protease